MKFACDCAPGRALKVTDTRRSGDTVRRRYVCNHCYKRATTIEVVVAYDNNKPSITEARRRLDAIKTTLFGDDQQDAARRASEIAGLQPLAISRPSKT